MSSWLPYVAIAVIALWFVTKSNKKSEPVKKEEANTPAATPVAVAAPVVAQDDNAIIAVIAAAIAAYGYTSCQIASIKPVVARSWTYTARHATVNTRNQMF